MFYQRLIFGLIVSCQFLVTFWISIYNKHWLIKPLSKKWMSDLSPTPRFDVNLEWIYPIGDLSPYDIYVLFHTYNNIVENIWCVTLESILVSFILFMTITIKYILLHPSFRIWFPSIHTTIYNIKYTSDILDIKTSQSLKNIDYFWILVKFILEIMIFICYFIIILNSIHLLYLAYSLPNLPLSWRTWS